MVVRLVDRKHRQAVAKNQPADIRGDLFAIGANLSEQGVHRVALLVGVCAMVAGCFRLSSGFAKYFALKKSASDHHQPDQHTSKHQCASPRHTEGTKGAVNGCKHDASPIGSDGLSLGRLQYECKPF